MHEPEDEEEELVADEVGADDDLLDQVQRRALVLERERRRLHELDGVDGAVDGGGVDGFSEQEESRGAHEHERFPHTHALHDEN